MVRHADTSRTDLSKRYPHYAPRGSVLADGVSCGICEAVASIQEPSVAAVRSVARARGHRYIEAWGYVCPRCILLIPRLSDPRRKYRDPGPKPSDGLKRVRIHLKIE